MGKKKEARRLSQALKESAMSLGMCEDGISSWLDYKSLDELCEHYWEGIEFIIQHPGWPSNKWLLDNVGITTLNNHGIYIDDNVVETSPKRMVFNGHCVGKVFAEGFSAPDLYVRNDSEVEVTATDASIVHVNVYDDARLNVRCDKFAKCFIYQYGGTVTYEGEGKVVLRDKRG